MEILKRAFPIYVSKPFFSISIFRIVFGFFLVILVAFFKASLSLHEI